MNVKFFGGPWNGRRQTVPDTRPIFVSVRPKIPSYVTSDTLVAVARTVRYNVHTVDVRIDGETKSYMVAVPSGTSPHDALARMLT